MNKQSLLSALSTVLVLQTLEERNINSKKENRIPDIDLSDFKPPVNSYQKKQRKNKRRKKGGAE